MFFVGGYLSDLFWIYCPAREMVWGDDTALLRQYFFTVSTLDMENYHPVLHKHFPEIQEFLVKIFPTDIVCVVF